MKLSLLCLSLMWVGAALAADALVADSASRGGLPNFFSRLERGDDTRVAFLGGSITAQDGWRPKTLRWLRDQYPQAKIAEINAAIGGTGSDLGVFRLRRDVLAHQPHLLLVEFAVNDAGAAVEQIHRCIEGIVRQTWRESPATDICFIYTIAGNMLETLQSGQLPRSYAAMEAIARHYQLPSINLGIEVARLEKAGKLVFKGPKAATPQARDAADDRIIFSPDGVHPYPDTGHEVYLQALIRAMTPIKVIGRAGPHELPPPFVADNWEDASMLPLSKARLSANWRKLDPATNRLARQFSGRMQELWTADQPGETLEFTFRGTAAGIYDLLGPDSGQVAVTLDAERPAIRPRFDAFSTYHRLATLMIGTKLSNGVHSVRIAIHPDLPDKAAILSQRNEKMDDPRRFDGRSWYAGALLLIGKLTNEEAGKN